MEPHGGELIFVMAGSAQDAAAMLPAETLLQLEGAGDPPLLLTAAAAARLAGEHPPRDARFWIPTMLALGSRALLEAAATLEVTPDLDIFETNTLSLLSGLVVKTMRRSMLLLVLNDTNWNLSRTARRLRMHDASAVRKEIDLLGLRLEYRAARKARLVRRGARLRDDADRPAVQPKAVPARPQP